MMDIFAANTTNTSGSTTTVEAAGGLTDAGKKVAQQYAENFVAGIRDKYVEKRHKEMMLVFSAIRADEDVAARFAQGIFPESGS